MFLDCKNFSVSESVKGWRLMYCVARLWSPPLSLSTWLIIHEAAEPQTTKRTLLYIAQSFQK